MRSLPRFAIVAGLSLAAGRLHAEEPVRVFAAASLTDALNEIGAQWQAQGHPAPVLTYGASSTLAKQIAAAAPADVFAAADLSWMDYLDSRGRIVHRSRVNLLGNELVLIVPRGRRFPVRMEPDFDIAAAFEGRLCTGEPDTVPAGIYAKESLQALGWWRALDSRIVGTDDVRTALTFVERGECLLGIVYGTDAAVSGKVEILARFPAETHKPIVYPFAIVKNAHPEARAWLGYLMTSSGAKAVFTRYGFTRPDRS